MKLNIFAVAMSAAVLTSAVANAQTTTVIETAPPPAVVVQPAPPAAVVVEPAPSTTVRSEKTEYGIGGILGSERRTTTNTGNCQQHTTQTNTLLGSNSKTTETCY
jgi:hypothetical protein